jgi:hypothetical protein
MPTLISSNDGKVRRQQVDDLPLPFISPLRTKYGDVHGRDILHCLDDRDGMTKRSSVKQNLFYFPD